MVIYEVNLSISKHIKQKVLQWLPLHIKELLVLPGFVSAQVYEESRDENSPDSIVVHYKLSTIEQLNYYLKNEAEQRRQEAIELFGNNLSATRRILHRSTEKI